MAAVPFSAPNVAKIYVFVNKCGHGGRLWQVVIGRSGIY